MTEAMTPGVSPPAAWRQTGVCRRGVRQPQAEDHHEGLSSQGDESQRRASQRASQGEESQGLFSQGDESSQGDETLAKSPPTQGDTSQGLLQLLHAGFVVPQSHVAVRDHKSAQITLTKG